MVDNDNIIALASPSGVGAISLIRISGPESIEIVDNFFRGVEKLSLKDQQSSKVQLGYIYDKKNTIDKVLITVFRNPKSYTGEDLVEISCHGSLFIQQSIIQLLLSKNCRIANAGEFTMRSFLNGKMDLSQAESVADLISSNSEASHRLAMNQMRGGFKNDINDLRSELVNFASLIELELDFSQEDVEFANMNELISLLDRISLSLKTLIDSFKTGNVIKNGIPVVIAGEPNSGKSTLLNSLLNEERAIVSPIPGTTRDTVEDQINLNGVICRFIDTAGIRSTKDEIESIGIERTFKKIKEAEIIIYLIDYSKLDSSNMDYYIDYLNGINDEFPEKKLILVLNKEDEKSSVEIDGLSKFKPISISAKNKVNISALKDEITTHVNSLTSQIDNSTISNSRHYDLLNKTYEEIHKVKSAINNKVSADLLAIDIKQSIYRWRGGNWRLLKDQVKQDIGIEASQDYQLDANWRSGKNIVEFNNKLFATMPVVARHYFADLLRTHEKFVENALGAYDGVAQKVMLTDEESYVNITYFEADDKNTWSEVALKKTIAVVEELQFKGYQLRDIAILVRTKDEGKFIADMA